MVVATTMTTGQLVSLFSYSLQILMSLMMLSMVFVMLSISRASAERIVEVMNEKPDLHNPVAPVREVKNGEIRFEQVSFSYSNDPDHLCLVDINLQIEAGQTVGIIGAPGAEKPPWLTDSRLYDVTKGAVYVGRVDVVPMIYRPCRKSGDGSAEELLSQDH